jgi:NADPH:quinone reductase-like Zn-dependent oxidoreductase
VIRIAAGRWIRHHERVRALEYDSYGGIDRLVLRDAPEPAMERGGVRVRVVRAALNPKDAVVRGGKLRLISGRRFPKRSGVDFAGQVVASDTPRFQPGDRVFGALHEWKYARGALAEQTVARDEEVAALPPAVSYEAGAALALVGLTVLQALCDLARLRPGARVLIHGASGGVGTAAIQIARLLGGRVTTRTSAASIDLCRELGAEQALDRESPEPIAPDHSFDCVLDLFGNLGLPRARALLAPGGTFVTTVPSPRHIAMETWSRLSGRSERLVAVGPDRADLDRLAAWLADGSLRAVVDSRFPLTDFAGAFGRLESKRSRGKIIVEVAGD